MSKRRFSLRGLFSNTKFLIAFSIFVALIFWIVVALQYAPVVENVIEDVPVQLDMDNSVPDKLGLQIFGQSDYTVDITVKGNRYVVGGNLLSPDDFDVTAQTAYVDSSGNHNLQLKVTTKDVDVDYEIVSVSEDYIEVYFDKLEEKEFEVTPIIKTELTSLTDDDFLFDEDDIILTTTTVTLSGAKTEIDKVQSVYADVEVTAKLTESMTYDSPIVLDGGTNEDIKYVKINGETSLTVPVTLPVYKTETLPVSVSFKNSPSAYISNPLSYTCNPSTSTVAVLQNGSTSDTTVEVGVVDFSSLSTNNNVFTFNASGLQNVKVLDGTKAFKVTVNVESITSMQYVLDKSKVTVSGADEKVSVDVDLSSTGNITVVGSSTGMDAITASMLSGKIDLTGVDLSSGSARVPITVTVGDVGNCWVYGTYYAQVKTK